MRGPDDARAVSPSSPAQSPKRISYEEYIVRSRSTPTPPSRDSFARPTSREVLGQVLWEANAIGYTFFYPRSPSATALTGANSMACASRYISPRRPAIRARARRASHDKSWMNWPNASPRYPRQTRFFNRGQQLTSPRILPSLAWLQLQLGELRRFLSIQTSCCVFAARPETAFHYSGGWR